MTAPPSEALPDPKTLGHDQLHGWACALCNTRLHADRPLGKVTVRHGPDVIETYELWACRPSCAQAPARRPTAT